MTPVAFFFVGMLLIWAVVSGKAQAIWAAITGGMSNNPPGVTPNPNGPIFQQPGAMG